MPESISREQAICGKCKKKVEVYVNPSGCDFGFVCQDCKDWKEYQFLKKKFGE